MKNILITGVGAPPGLGCLKSLIEFDDINVFVTDINKYAQGFYSYNVKKSFVVPRAKSDKYIDRLLSISKEEKIDMIIPCSDDEVHIISKNKNSFDEIGVRTSVPEYNILKIAYDKRQTIEFARENDILHPRTFFVENIEEIPRDIAFPLVIKPRSAQFAKGIHYVDTFEELEERFNEVKKDFGIPLIQEYIPGEEGSVYTLGSLFNQGECVCKIVQRKLKENPPTGGAATVGITEENKEVEKIGINLLEKMNWHGLAAVELKKHKRNGKYYLMEINPRYWGYGYLSTYAGLNFPYYLVCEEFQLEYERKENYLKNKILIRTADDVLIDKGDLVE